MTVMGVEARSVPPAADSPKRKLRNYLLDRRFQLKYTGMVVGVTLVVASILGAMAYHESKGQTEALQIQLAMQPDLDPQVASNLEAFGRERDRQMLLAIVAGVLALTFALGITGIIITHRLVGPAYRLRKLFGTVASGQLRVDGALRRNDELQDVFAAFNGMVERLRARQSDKLSRLESLLEHASERGLPEDVLQELRALRDRMRSELDG